jgi:hypothetical protein
MTTNTNTTTTSSSVMMMTGMIHNDETRLDLYSAHTLILIEIGRFSLSMVQSDMSKCWTCFS